VASGNVELTTNTVNNSIKTTRYTNPLMKTAQSPRQYGDEVYISHAISSSSCLRCLSDVRRREPYSKEGYFGISLFPDCLLIPECQLRHRVQPQEEHDRKEPYHDAMARSIFGPSRAPVITLRVHCIMHTPFCKATRCWVLGEDNLDKGAAVNTRP
jgi:hypothetical protein